MTSSQETAETRASKLTSATLAPFEVWSDWFRNNMGATLGAPGVNDPLMSAMEDLQNAAPLSNLIPVDWREITQALQTLWMREMSNPVHAMQAATELNRRLVEATMGVWNDAAARFWGLPWQKEEGKPDKRFSTVEWESNPYYQTLKQMYLLASDYLLKEAEATTDQNTVEGRRLKFHLKQFVDAMAPVNFLLTNPAALKRIVETGGTSLAEGTRNLLADLKEGRVSMTDANAFKPGENLATTPGQVVFRNELIELIQYAPQTTQVYEVPLLFIPPWINKYYILDLRPENSMIRYMVEQGFTVFVISWKNPDASMEGTGFDDYMTLGPLAAVDAICDITGSDKVNPVGYCIGGTLLTVTLAWLAAGNDKKAQAFGATTFMVSMQDFAEVGETEVFMDEPQFELMENQMLERGYLDQQTTSNMFNLLRSSDLIWANVINNYLLGQKPPAFDMLYWNADGTRMARNAHSFYIRNTYLENNLIKPGKVQVKGRPLDLGQISGEIYAVGAETDHIVPWASAWKVGQLVGGPVRFALASSGHIAGMINPPAKGKGKYWVNESGDAGSTVTADEWRKNATEHQGSWWVDWGKWLKTRSGKKVKPPSMGSQNHPPIEAAPGTYVKEK
ncbi:MAG TPA: class I poly(R)-hydroxyalkanoic acid synthase [Gammaproteobacteria bacterium]|nr:class I poly(R)-hydroxyalkanoic acid synthase [Gammaproteobacteria bacterium]